MIFQVSNPKNNSFCYKSSLRTRKLTLQSHWAFSKKKGTGCHDRAATTSMMVLYATLVPELLLCLFQSSKTLYYC